MIGCSNMTRDEKNSRDVFSRNEEVLVTDEGEYNSNINNWEKLINERFHEQSMEQKVPVITNNLTYNQTFVFLRGGGREEKYKWTPDRRLQTSFCTTDITKITVSNKGNSIVLSELLSGLRIGFHL